MYTKLDPTHYEELYEKSKKRKTLEERLEETERELRQARAVLAAKEAPA